MKSQYKILRVDLTRGRIRSERVKRGWERRFIGGKGLGAAYLFDELKKGIDPLSPENKLMFFIGPITGIAPGTSRYVVVTKSPLTGTFLDSYAGGHFPAELGFALPGHHGIIFEGRAEELVYLKVDHGEVEIVNAGHLKGKTTTDVKDSFPDFKVASIGIAGENLVRFACITNDFGRNAGRGGAGAVMGSKNLKAVVVRGKKNAKFSKRIMELRKRHQKRLLKLQKVFKFGTSSVLELCNDSGILPTRNWSYGTFKDAEKISAKAIEENLVSRGSCYFCSVNCHMLTKAKKGLFKGVYVNGPEYETLAMGGSNTSVGDFSAVSEFNRICNDLGMDTISTGSAISWAMECSERGIIEDKIPFGDGKAVVELAKKIAYREGIGNLLAEGVARSAERLGKKAKEAGVHVKGMEVPGYDPRGTVSMALAYATSDRGACHLRAWPVGKDAFGELDPYSIEGKAKIVIEEQDKNSAKWSLVACNFTGYSPKDAVEFLNEVTGYDITEEEYHTIGERIFNLTRLFNVREGFSKAHDCLPERFERPLKEGVTDGRKIKREDFEKMLEEYYERRGWSKDGIPTEETLKRLGLEDFVKI